MLLNVAAGSTATGSTRYGGSPAAPGGHDRDGPTDRLDTIRPDSWRSGSLPSTMLITMRTSKPSAAAQARTGVANRSENLAAERVLTDLETLDARPGRGT